MITHKLHEVVAEAINIIVNGKFKIQLDSACGVNKQQLPFFLTVDAKRDYAVAKVDLMLIKNQHVKLVCEIEESGFHPTKIYGKVFSTASALMSKLSSGTSFEMDQHGVFIQILSSENIEKKLKKPKNTKKYKQGLAIEKKIRIMLSNLKYWINDYHIIFGTPADFCDVNSDPYKRLEKIINNL